MENASEITLKQLAGMVADARLLLVHPPADGLVAMLAAGRQNKLSVFSWDAATVAEARSFIGSTQVLSAVQVSAWTLDAALAEATLAGLTFDQVVIFMPKARERLDLTLSLMVKILQCAKSVALVGEKRSGVESAGKRLRLAGWDSVKAQSARHSQWWQIRPPTALPTGAGNFWKSYELAVPNLPTLSVSSLPGVFSHGELDDGTAILLEALSGLLLGSGSVGSITEVPGKSTPVAALLGAELPELKSLHRDTPSRVLDFGCGAGVISLWMLAVCRQWTVDSLDIDLLALLCTARNAAVIQNVEARLSLLHGDGIAQLQQNYHMIISNPPFHQGQRQDLSATSQMLANCRRHLLPGGCLLMVANRFLPYPELLADHFRHWQVLRENGKFRVYHATV
jgi:16S rRNA (guanine1207-N2)-methyltransferase